MSAKSKQLDMKAAKERRQKKIIIGGGVLLLVLVAIQVPRLMSSGSSSSSASDTSTTTASASTTEPGTAAAASAVPASRTRLPDSDTPPKRDRSQLVSFERFDSKDPFVQQVSEETIPAAATAAPAQSPAPTTTSASTSAGPTTTTGAAPSPTRATAGTSASALTATIEVNGKAESVAVSDTFPKANPTFRLVSLGGGVAMVGIADGAYASGAQTVALQTGKTLTLVNTADGVRYELRLVSSA